MFPSDLDLLHHIQEETTFILDHTINKDLKDILSDAVLNRAIIRSIEIIGEASKKLSTEFKDANPTIEWRKIAAIRNKLIHEYFGIDYEIVWDIIENKLPALKKAVAEIFNAGHS